MLRDEHHEITRKEYDDEVSRMQVGGEWNHGSGAVSDTAPGKEERMHSPPTVGGLVGITPVKQEGSQGSDGDTPSIATRIPEMQPRARSEEGERWRRSKEHTGQSPRLNAEQIRRHNRQPQEPKGPWEATQSTPISVAAQHLLEIPSQKQMPIHIPLTDILA